MKLAFTGKKASCELLSTRHNNKTSLQHNQSHEHVTNTNNLSHSQINISFMVTLTTNLSLTLSFLPHTLVLTDAAANVKAPTETQLNTGDVRITTFNWILTLLLT